MIGPSSLSFRFTLFPRPTRNFMLPPTIRYSDLPFAQRLTLRRPGLRHFLGIGTRARRSRHSRFAHMLHPMRKFRIRNFVPDDESEFCAPRNCPAPSGLPERLADLFPRSSPVRINSDPLPSQPDPVWYQATASLSSTVPSPDRSCINSNLRNCLSQLVRDPGGARSHKIVAE